MNHVRPASKGFPRPETRSRPITKCKVITLPTPKGVWPKEGYGYEFGPETIAIPLQSIVDNCELLKFASVIIVSEGKVIIDPINVQKVETVIVAVDNSRIAIEIRYQGKMPPIEVAFALMEIAEPNEFNTYGNPTNDYRSALLFKLSLQYISVEEAEAEFPVDVEPEVFASA